MPKVIRIVGTTRATDFTLPNVGTCLYTNEGT